MMLRLLVVLATTLSLVMGYLANTTFLNGIVTGEVSRLYDTPFTPAGWVFGIWGPLYTGLIIWSVWQAVGPGARSTRAAALRPAYIVSCVANSLWLPVWHYDHLALSLLVMLVLLGAVAWIRREIARTPPASAGERWLCDLVFRAYVAWVTVATLANAAQVAVYTFGAAPLATALAGLVLAAVIAGVVAWQLRDWVYLAVFAWAASGIVLKPEQLAEMSLAAGVLGGVVLALIGFVLARPRERAQRAT